MGAYSRRTIRVPVPAQYSVRICLEKWSTHASEVITLHKNVIRHSLLWWNFYYLVPFVL